MKITNLRVENIKPGKVDKFIKTNHNGTKRKINR